VVADICSTVWADSAESPAAGVGIITGVDARRVRVLKVRPGVREGSRVCGAGMARRARHGVPGPEGRWARPRNRGIPHRP